MNEGVRGREVSGSGEFGDGAVKIFKGSGVVLRDVVVRDLL